MLCMREAIATPRLLKANASRNISPTTCTTMSGVSDTPTSGATSSNSKPCNNATLLPPSALPIATEVREMGATWISLRKPNSRSHMMLIEAKMLVNSTLMASTPGYMKVV